MYICIHECDFCKENRENQAKTSPSLLITGGFIILLVGKRFLEGLKEGMRKLKERLNEMKQRLKEKMKNIAEQTKNMTSSDRHGSVIINGNQFNSPSQVCCFYLRCKI